MTKATLLATLLLTAFAGASAQITSVSTDILGAHLNYGRGCTACHAPHSGSSGNGMMRTATGTVGSNALWGQDASQLYGKTITTGGGKYTEVLPTSLDANTPDVTGILACLSCHDGNYASGSMMKNKVYESLPATYGRANNVPTLIGHKIGGSVSYLNEHPLGLNAKVECGKEGSWDCSMSNGQIMMTGAKSSRFVKNYGFFIKPGSYNNTAVITCVTCHDPHSMNVVTVTRASSSSGLPPGTYATMFFLRGPYNPSDTNPNSNQTAQFCRQCHADLSNEMNGSTAGTVF